MKKILFTIILFLCSINVITAANNIYSIDMKIYIDEFGNASIAETWHVDGSDGTEWYKVYNNLGNSKLTDFKVYMDGNLLTYKNWNVNESLNAKKGFYGINYTNSGLELCFGKYDYKEHTFKLTYKISDFIFNTADSQVLYWNLIDKLTDVRFNNFTVEVSSFYEFPDNLDVWGYGYKGYAYVENGKIKMSNEGKMNNKYVVLLVKFPLNTFNTKNTDKRFSNFDSVLKMANQNTFEYNYNIDKIIEMVISAFTFLASIIIIFSVTKTKKYGYINNKKISKKDTPFFRDIPCNKDIYYANALVSLNNFSNSNSNILGAILLKWIKIGKVSVVKNEKNTSLSLNKDLVLENKYENDLFDMIYSASIDGILEKKELERWAQRNYTRYLNLFDKIKNNKIYELERQGRIYERTNRKECKYKNVMDDTIYKDSKQLYGLKLFLEEFTNIKDKEAIEVHLWDQYLMFAFLFGIADKVAKQFKDLYPEIFESSEYMNQYGGLDFDTIFYLNHISYSSARAASSARSAAQSYSSGGGGFSIGGGGGGSFGGGGGGSR